MLTAEELKEIEERYRQPGPGDTWVKIPYEEFVFYLSDIRCLLDHIKELELKVETAEARVQVLEQAGQAALTTMIEWYVQDQADIIGTQQAKQACLREVSAARTWVELLKVQK